MSITGISTPNPLHVADAPGNEHVAKDSWNLALDGAKDAANASNVERPGISLQNTGLYNTSGPNANEPHLSDIHQGANGDCSFLASLGALAQNDPNAVKNMIHDNGNGTYTVTFHVQNDDFHGLWGVCGNSYTTRQVTISANDISRGGALGQHDNGKQVMWPAVVEAAYAKVHETKIFGHDLSISDLSIHRFGINSPGIGGSGIRGLGINDINSGHSNVGNWPQTVLENLTGRDAQSYNPLVFLIVEGAGLKSQFDSGKLITVSTPESDGTQGGYDNGLNPYGLIGGHTYTVTNVYMKNGQEYVSLNNPWGFNQPQDIPLSALPKVSDNIAVGSV